MKMTNYSKIFQPPAVIIHGAFLTTVLSTKSRPGDGSFGRGVKGGSIYPWG